MRLRTTALVVLALSAAACGSSKHTASTGSTASTSTSTPVNAQTTTQTTSRAPVETASTLTAPPPVPRSTPAAPAGLSQTVGYGTYELCAQSCSASVPSSLRRQVALPAASGGSCPVSAGKGPVKPQGDPTHLAISPFIGSAWKAGRVTWQASGYSGPILIRGFELGGQGVVGFGEGHVPYDELQLLGHAMGAPPGIFPSFTRVRSAGCYAYVVTGTSFTDVIVFKAS